VSNLRPSKADQHDVWCFLHVKLTSSIEGIVRLIKDYAKPDLARIDHHDHISVFFRFRISFSSRSVVVDRKMLIHASGVHDFALVMGDIARGEITHLGHDVARFRLA
jgi:hypothetical protein